MPATKKKVKSTATTSSANDTEPTPPKKPNLAELAKKTKAVTPKKHQKAPSPPPSPQEQKSAKEATTSKKTKETKTAPTPRKKEKVAKAVLTVDSFLPKVSADFVLTCGNGDTGQLGHGEDVTVVKRPRPVKSFPDGTTFLQAVAGGMHTVVLTSSFEVYTSGCNDEGALGRVCYDDDGNQVDKDEDFIFRKVLFPEGCGDLVMISAGDSHTAALTRDGSVYIWGTFRDKRGSLGLAMDKPKDQGNLDGWKMQKPGQIMQKTKEPFLLSSSKDQVIVKIASGSDHIVLLDQNGNVLTSGAGDSGQLGRLTPHSRDSEISKRTIIKMMTPGQIFVKNGVSFENIWCASYCSFARDVNGKIYVWGLNNYRQLGVLPKDPEAMDVHYPMVSERFESTKVWNGFAGDHHILAVEEGGTCYAIGRGDDCRLGQGEGNTANSDTLVEISSGGVIGVAAATGTSFFWNNEGRGYAWGLNNEAELGLGVEEGSVVEKPKQIEIRAIQGDSRIIMISGNAQHTVVLASRIDEPDGAPKGNAA